MKELTIEEKAKAYDRAFERAKKLHETCDSQAVVGWCEYIFPELHESEDEKVREDIISLVNEFWERIGSINPEYSSRNRMLAWLEKQANHANFRNKIRIGDKVTRNRDGVIVNLSQLNRVAKKDEKQSESYTKKDVDDAFVEGMAFAKDELEKQGEQKSTDESKFKVGDWIVSNEKLYVYQIEEINEFVAKVREINGETFVVNVNCLNDAHLWTIQDAKDGDVLLFEGYYNSIVLFQGIGINGEGKINYHCKCDLGNYSFGVQGDVACLGTIEKDAEHYHPATKEQRDTLMKAMTDAGWKFDFKKKELMKIEKNTDVNHEYFSELLENDDSKDINDYAYQVAYCISHDWLKETATWDDVEKACKLGAEWNKRHHKSAWSDEDKKIIGRIRSIVEKYAFSQSAVDVNGDLCEKEYIDADNWLKSLKDRVQPQPKHEWSEEDEVKINRIVACLENLNVADNDILLKDVDWLKSLKERYIWKPSKEQMDAMQMAVSYFGYSWTSKEQKLLESLYKDLKKLTEG